MEHKYKLLKLVEALSEHIGNDPDFNEIFDEYPLLFTTTCWAESINFCNNQIYCSEAHSNYRDLLDELEKLKKVYDLLFTNVTNFFKGLTNKQIEEKYGLGIEEEE